MHYKCFNFFLSVRQTNKLKAGTTPWPPFRAPAPCAEAYEDPCKLLRSRVFHAIALVVLYKAINGHVSEHVMALICYLLEMAVITSEPSEDEVRSKNNELHYQNCG